MAKMVEMTFAIGAALTGGFNATFGKAGQALVQLQQQSAELQKMSGQVSGYQKMQEAIAKNQAAMVEARNQAKALESQIASSSQKTAALKSQYGEAQAKVESLNAVLVRNRDAYKAAQLNAQSLENQIKNSKAPTAELQKQYATAQEEVRRLGGAVKQSATDFKNAQANAKRLKSEMQNSASQTKALTNEAKNLNSQADKLQTGLNRDREALAKMRTELSGAGIDTKNLAAEQEKLAQKSQRVAEAQTRLQNSRAALEAKRQQLSFSNIKGELMTAAGLGYSLYKPTMEAADFEQAMARVNAVAFSGGNNRTAEQKAANAEAFKALQEQARQLGRDTQYTAVQAAQTQENLARAGFSSNEIISAMPGLLSMAAAEGMDLANAADIAASTLRGFNLSADQTNRVADVLAQTSAASNTSIAALGDSMKYVAPVASGLGISVEEVSAMLGIMANAGIKGSQGGTALRAALNRLSKEPKAVEKALNALGVKSRDANGNMRDMTELLTALQSRLKSMGNADQMQYLSNIFGSEAAAGMLAVMNSAVDGTLGQLKLLNYESNGILNEISSHIKIPIEELRAGMENALPAAQHLGISYKDLSVYLGMLAKGGLQGAKVDKALTIAFDRLAEKPQEVQKALKQFNISAFDDKGKLRELPVLMKEISAAVMGMEQGKRLNILEQIFGKNSGETMQVLMKGFASGADKALIEVAGKATGVSKEMADKVNNTMRGAMTQAGSAVSDLMITIGYVLLPTVTDIVKSFKEWTSWIGKLAHENPAWTKAIIGTVGALAALKVGMTATKIGWNLLTLPYHTAKVAFDTLNVKTLENAKNMAEASKKTGLFSRAFQGLSKGLSSIGKGIGSFFKNMWSMGKNLINGLFSPMGLKILAIAGIIAAVAAAAYLIYKNWDKIKAWWNSWTLKDVFAVVKDYAARAWAYVKQKWNDFLAWWNSWSLADIFAPLKEYAKIAKEYVMEKWEALKAWWNSWSFGDIFAPLQEYASMAKDYVISKWENLKSWWNSWTLADIFAPVKQFATDMWSGVMEKWESLKSWWNSWSIKDIFSGILPENFSLPEISWENVTAGFENAKSLIASGWEKLKSNFNLDALSWENLTAGFDTARNVISSGWQKLKGVFTLENLSGIWDTLSSGFASVCDTIKGVWQGVTGFIKDTWDTVSDYVSGAWKWTKGLFGVDTDAEDLQAQIQDITVLNKMSETFSQRVAEMTAAWQPFKVSLGEGFEQIYSTMQGVADRIRSVTIPAVNELTNALSKIASEINSIVQAGELKVKVEKGNSPQNFAPSYMRGYATGGFINYPQIALIGEAGREAVIPLEDKARGIPLWKAAGEEMGLLFGNTTNNNDNRSNSVVLSPSFNITVNGGEQGIEQKFRQIIEDVLNNLKNDMERVSFA